MNRKLFIGLLVIQIAQSTCPQVPRIGNAINLCHLFRERAKLDFNCYNNDINAEFITQVRTMVTGGFEDKVLFRVTDVKRPQRQWYYFVAASFTSDSVLTGIKSYARIRVTSSQASNDAILQTLFQDNTISSTAAPFNCNDLFRLEFIFFPYMYKNFWKNGTGETEPVIS